MFDNVDLRLNLFRERGQTRSLQLFGLVNVPIVERIMWPTWVCACRIPGYKGEGTYRGKADVDSCITHAMHVPLKSSSGLSTNKNRLGTIVTGANGQINHLLHQVHAVY